MLTFEQKGSRVEGGLLTDEFLDSAANVLQGHRGRTTTKGAQQFFTPPEVASFIAAVLVDEPGKEPDPTFDPVGAGAGNLLSPFAHRYGIEIDRDYASEPYHKIIGDCQVVADLGMAIGLKCRRIVANPPFGLRWKWRGEEGRSAKIAWQIIEDLLAYNGCGALIVPERDALAISSAASCRIVAAVEVPAMFGRDVDADCGILFFAERAYLLNRTGTATYSASVDRLPDLVPELRAKMKDFVWQSSDTDENFRDKFDLLRREFQERQKNEGKRHSCIQVHGKKLKVYLSPFERVRLVTQGNRSVQDRITALNGQSIYQFVDCPKDWQDILEMAKEGDLEIGPEVLEAYERVRQEAELIRAPMLPQNNDVLRVAALRDVSRISCKLDDEEQGFKAGEVYQIISKTTTVTEYSTRQVIRNRRDSRTGQLVPQIEMQDIMTERQAILFRINGQDFVISNEKDADLIRYLVEHFDLPEVKTIAELQPEEFEYWCNRLRKVVRTYDAA